MNLKRAINTTGAVAIVLPTMVACSESVAEQKQPNILYIMSDDHTTQGIGLYGSRLSVLNPTPTIDRIGREGVMMTNTYCTNAISTPSRGCIISGQYSQTSGVLDLDSSLPIESQHLPQEMKKLGYQTAVVGKWHLHNQPEMFDYYNVFYGQGEYFDPVLCEKGDTEMVPLKYQRQTEVVGKRYKGHSSDVVTDITLDWLKNKRDKDKPFFLCHQFKAPHDMFEFNPRYADYLEDTFIPEPESLWDNQRNGSIATKGVNDELIHIIGSSVGKRNTIRNMGMHMDIDPNLPDDEYKRAAYQEYIKRYLRCVKGVDDNVKRIFDYLEAEGLMDNTIIIYTGDQGFVLGEHDYIDKRWMYDECMRMPFMVRYPSKIKAGTVMDAMTNNVDFAPTIISMAGGEVPDYMQGDSFKELIYSGKEPDDWKKATYYRYWMHMAHRHNNPAHFGIRTKDYKLIFYYGVDYKERPVNAKKFKGVDPNDSSTWEASSLPRMQTPAAWELYDLRKDPNELNNVYGDPKYKKITEELKADLKKMREDLNETDAAYPHIQKIIDANWDK
ncbi:MAG: sulfatase [Rikenellaceae bacterium]